MGHRSSVVNLRRGVDDVCRGGAEGAAALPSVRGRPLPAAVVVHDVGDHVHDGVSPRGGFSHSREAEGKGQFQRQLQGGWVGCVRGRPLPAAVVVHDVGDHVHDGVSPRGGFSHSREAQGKGQFRRQLRGG